VDLLILPTITQSVLAQPEAMIISFGSSIPYAANAGCMLSVFLAVMPVIVMAGATGHSAEITPDRLVKVGQALVQRSHYLEALDLFDEAKDVLESSGKDDGILYADVLYLSARTKIQGRLHQAFAAQYVKNALLEVQESNRRREKIKGVLPQKLAEGYYLEGFILKRFFLKTENARACFLRAVRIDPASVAAKRELSELLADPGKK
jgi:tetratricopeptide (TPR) repeat protein